MESLPVVLLVVLVAVVGFGLVQSSRSRRRQRADALDHLGPHLRAERGAGFAGRESLHFQREGRQLELQFAPDREWTHLLLHFQDGEDPGLGDLRIRARGARTLADLADRPRGEEILESGFARRFEVDYLPQDRAFLHHLLDAPGRRLVEDLDRLRGGEDIPVIEFLAGPRCLRLGARGLVREPRQLDRLLGLGIQLARRFAPAPASASPAPASTAPMEV